MPVLIDDFRRIVAAQGLWHAMRWLNGRVPYRYTAIFRFDGDMLRNICLVDKQDPTIATCEDQPITESYCVYIHRSGKDFSVEDAPKDSRVADHPKRRSFACYYGVPLLGSSGRLLGTVCHFDIFPTRITDGVVSALDDLAPLITEAAFPATTYP